MTQVLIGIIPIILIMIWGFALKKFKFLNESDGSTLFKLIFYAGMPALIFKSITTSQIDASFLILAIFPTVMVLLSFLIGFGIRKTILQKIDIKTFAVMLIGMVIMNTGIIIPFIENAYGKEGIARLAIIDLGNAIITFTLVYAFAVKSGGGKVNAGFILKKLLISPPIWALIAALLVKAFGISVPETVVSVYELLARLVSPVILVAIGLKFNPVFKQLQLVAIGLTGRFLFGGLIGFLFVTIFGITGLNAVIIILCSMAPIGFNSITFSDLEKLDSKYASIQVSAGLLIGVLLIPFLITVLNSIYL